MTWAVPLTCPGVLLVGWLWLLACMCCGLAECKLRFPVWWIPVVAWRAWFARHWRFSTTIGFAVAMHPDHGARIFQHEMVHIRQFRDAGILGLIIGLVVCLVTGDLALGVGLWLASPAYLIAHFIGAFVTGGHVYRDAEHERSAYAQTDEAGGTSWLERQGATEPRSVRGEAHAERDPMAP